MALFGSWDAGRQSGLPTRLAERSVTTETQRTAADSKVGPYEGMRAPDSTFRTIDGRTMRLSELRGKFVVVWFMAAWCPSCASVGPAIKEVVKEKGDRVVVIVVDLWTRQVLKMAGLEGRPGVPPPEDADVLTSFVSQWGDRRWHLVLDESGELAREWRIAYVDTTFVIDSEGIVRLRSDGPITQALLSASLPPPTGS